MWAITPPVSDPRAAISTVDLISVGFEPFEALRFLDADLEDEGEGEVVVLAECAECLGEARQDLAR